MGEDGGTQVHHCQIECFGVLDVGIVGSLREKVKYGSMGAACGYGRNRSRSEGKEELSRQPRLFNGSRG